MYSAVKRVVDLTVALIGLILLSPFLFVIALTVATTSSGGPFYRQVRVGLNGQEFRILKFRTMVRDADPEGSRVTHSGDPRITKVGAILRRTKLDELPQLINVISGEMSLVGPRPEVPEYVAHYTPEQRRVLSVCPGITDPASLAFSNESDILIPEEDFETTYVNRIMPQKLALSLQYLDSRCLSADLRLIVRTMARVFKSG
jgi:lipopolysaccharide/colanic/teichoic acid biosynthesis glycosyltransferase